MSEKESLVLPEGLPKRRDRTDIYTLYDNFDRLQDFGWKKNLLFKQKVELKDHTSRDIPIFFYTTPQKGESVWLVSGVHGHREQGGPMAIAQSIDRIGELGKDIPMVVIGLLNANYIKDKRYPDLPGGSRHSLCDFDFMCLDRSKAPLLRPLRESPSNHYAEHLGKRFLSLLKDYPATMLLDLHEDFFWPYQQNNHGLPHNYSDGILTYDDPVAQECVRIFNRLGTPLRMNSYNGSWEKTKMGIAHMYNGALENMFASTWIFQEGNLVPGPRVPVCIATETPNMHNGQPFSLEHRVNTQKAVISRIDKFRKIIEKSWTVYERALDKDSCEIEARMKLPENQR